MVGVLAWPHYLSYPRAWCFHAPFPRYVDGLVFVADAKARHKPTVNQGALHIINPKQALLMTLPCPGMNLEQ